MKIFGVHDGESYCAFFFTEKGAERYLEARRADRYDKYWAARATIDELEVEE